MTAQVEYGFNIDKLTNQFLSKLPQITGSQFVQTQSSTMTQMNTFEECIIQSLGMMKSSVLEFAERIKDRINQYYAATNSVTLSGLKDRVHECVKSLDLLNKSKLQREQLKLKLEVSTKEISNTAQQIAQGANSASKGGFFSAFSFIGANTSQSHTQPQHGQGASNGSLHSLSSPTLQSNGSGMNTPGLVHTTSFGSKVSNSPANPSTPVKVSSKMEIASPVSNFTPNKKDDKVTEMKRKRERDYKAKFDALTSEQNNLAQHFAKTFRDCVQQMRQYESTRNGVVMLGFDKLTNLYQEWGTKIANLNFPNVSDKLSTFSLIDRYLEGIPTSWVKQGIVEKGFEELIKELEAPKVTTTSTLHLENEIREQLLTLRNSISKSERLKAELYSNHLIGPNLTEAEEEMLDRQITMMVRDDKLTGYFLLLINYQLLLRGMELGELKMNHSGLLIYDAARIYYEEELENGTKEMISLIKHLDSGIMRQPSVWEHYFLFRTNRKLIQLSQTDSLKENFTPVKKVGQKDFVYGETYKQYMKYIQDNPKMVEATLKEIVYYLTMIEGLAAKARNILVRLFKRFAIQQPIVQMILFMEQRYNEAYTNSKIETIQRPKKSSLSTRPDRLMLALRKSVEYLGSCHDVIKLQGLNKSLRKGLRENCFRELLSRQSLRFEERIEIYKMIVPKQYKEEDYKLDKEQVPINPACARVIKLDLDRTCRNRPEIYRDSELLLHNYLHRNDTKMCYFQGLNFIATLIVEMFPNCVDRLNCIEYMATNVFGTFVNSKIYKDGLGFLILFYCFDRVLQLQERQIFSHLQREGIGVQLFAANPVITVFTWNSDLKVLGSPLMNLVWDNILMKPSSATLFTIVLHMVKAFSHFLFLCDMEDFMVTWDAFLGTRDCWFHKEFDKQCLAQRVSAAKLEKLDTVQLAEGMRGISRQMQEEVIPEELISVLYEEYYTLNHNMDQIQRAVAAELLTESEMLLTESHPQSQSP